MKNLIVYLLSFLLVINSAFAENWSDIKPETVAALNQNLVTDQPTVDVILYYANNFDKGFQKNVPLDAVLEQFRVAKDIYQGVGVQLKLVAIKSGYLDPKHFSIQTATVADEKPSDGWANMYEEMARHPQALSDEAKAAFNAIIKKDAVSDRTIHLIIMQGVYMPYYEGDKVGRVWTPTLVRTKGLSFPGYIHGAEMPRHLRGVITMSHHEGTNLRVIAHELGHKLMNVSHEYKEDGPQHESFKDGGLMLYGMGTDIPAGKEGRWHKERLHLSPFIYRLNAAGEKVWNADYKGDGFYYDPLYGDKVVHFDGVRR